MLNREAARGIGVGDDVAAARGAGDIKDARGAEAGYDAVATRGA